MLNASSKLWKERSKLTRWLEERRLVESRRPVLCVGGKEKWFARRDGCTEKVLAASLGECMRRPPRPSTCTMRITVAALVTRLVHYPLIFAIRKDLESLTLKRGMYKIAGKNGCIRNYLPFNREKYTVYRVRIVMRR